jgi:hypothetical protein
MREFFRGVRPKVGFVMLMLTLAVTIGWVRSLVIEDTFNLYRGTVIVESSNGRLWFEWFDEPIRDMPIWMQKKDRAVFLDQTVFQHEIDELDWKWWGFGRLGFEELPIIGIIPYWSVTATLTLFSTWLLLSKRAKIAVPIPSAESPK